MKNYIFHVHTYRCRHCSNESDESFIESAIQLGASYIAFSDHAPFPDNPFNNRMDITELPEYIETLSFLREKYAKHISVQIGLEIEYIRSFNDYYQKLSETEGLDFLLLGQHFYHSANNQYSFSDLTEFRIKNEAHGIINAMIEGIQTGFFRTIAHPDRAFRYCKEWGSEEGTLARRLIATAVKCGVMLEQNQASKEKGLYKSEFWNLFKSMYASSTFNEYIIQGLDAHSVSDMERRYISITGD